MTLESWSLNCATSNDAISSSWMFFVIYPYHILCVLNLFIGIIVNMQRFDDDALGQDPSKNVRQQEENTIEEIQALKTEIQELKQLIQKINTG